MHCEQCQWSASTGWTPKPGALGGAAQLALAFGDVTADGTLECLQSLGKLYPNAQLFGCSTAGEIQGTTLSEKSLSITAIAFEHTRVAATEAPVSSPGEAVRSATRAVAALPVEDLRHVLVFAPGNCLNGGEVVHGINLALPAGVSASGGFAAAGGNVLGSLVWSGSSPAPAAIAALGFYGSRLHVATGAGGGWHPFGPDRRITRCAHQTIYELDGGPALELYKHYLGDYAKDLPFSALRFPLGIRSHEDEPWQVRVINGIDEVNGGLSFDTEIAEKAHARFLVGNAENLVQGAMSAAQASREKLGLPVQLAIVVSCYGRKIVLGQQTEDELEALRQILGPDAAMTGFYSYGEISGLADKTETGHYNQTMTVTTMTEQ